jgi:uncharacterized YigZ family protein
MTEQAYWTVAAPAEAEVTVKRSRFIGLVAPARTPEDISRHLAYARTRWPRASHYCHASVLHTPFLERISDDGEPSGTAGKPMLAVLRGAGLADVTAVVTRYFGGTLLGTGGLVRAYAQALQEALKTASRVRMAPGFRLSLRMAYTLYDSFMHKLAPLAVGAVESVFTDEVLIGLTIPAAAAEAFERRLEALGPVSREGRQALYVPVDGDGRGF